MELSRPEVGSEARPSNVATVSSTSLESAGRFRKTRTKEESPVTEASKFPCVFC